MSSYSCSHDYASKHVFSCDHSLVTTEHWNIRKLSWSVDAEVPGQWLVTLLHSTLVTGLTQHWWPSVTSSQVVITDLSSDTHLVTHGGVHSSSDGIRLLFSPTHSLLNQHCYCLARHDDKIFNCCFFKYFLNTDERRKSWSQVYTYTLSLFEWLWAEELEIDPIGSSLSRWIQSSWLLSILLFRIPLTTHTHTCDCMTLQIRAC